MASIRQIPLSHALPDFRNLGVMLRALILANLLALLAVLLRNASAAALPLDIVNMAGRVEPPLLASLGLLSVLQPQLVRLSYFRGWVAVVLLGAAVTGALELLMGEMLGGDLPRAMFWAAATAVAVLLYFHLRAILATPAVAEARLQALSARIRPHFLFNTLNGVLGIIRSDPRRAEHALEELSDLFRVLMKENRDLVTLEDEVQLGRQYLDLETLRLGERLQVTWKNKDCPMDARVPPLMLQPLLENAVYHGIEPSSEPGEVSIFMARQRGDIMIEIANPLPRDARQQAGNGMAMDNIRERLMLFYDLEARLDTLVGDGLYRVRIRLPYRTSLAKEAANG
ncbi:MAG: histidine kinase [Sterolibacteriaceae bacterium]|nr:histidine kinase [Sterolibacteriaceae bacterium]MBK9083860.1 histidine kinase [Sterolibacteriaceae bacterium]